MNELLAQIEALLANPEATIEEMAALLGEVQAALAASVTEADASTEIDEAQLVEVAKSLQKLEAKMTKKNAAIEAKNYISNLEVKVSKPVNQLRNETKTAAPSGVKRTKVYGSDEEALGVGLFIGGLMGNKHMAARWENEFGAKTLTSTSGPSVGFLIPTEMDNNIIRLREKYGVARSLATVVSMGSDTKEWLKEVSGNSAYFVNEGTEFTATDVSYRKLTLAAKLLAVRTKFNQTTDDDAIVSLADEITDWAARAIAIKEDQCFLIGDGSSTYGGMIGASYVWRKQTEDNGGTWTTDGDKDNNAGLLLATGSTWASITDDDMVQVQGRVADYPGINPVWVCSRQFYYDVMQRLAINAGGNTTVEYVNGVPQGNFLGIPVVFSNAMPKATAVDQVPVLFGDFKLGSVLGDRKGITVETDKNIATQVNDVVVTSRFDVLVHDFGNYNATATSWTYGAIAGIVTKHS